MKCVLLFPLHPMSPILKTLRRALASSICAVVLSSAVSPTTSVAANNTNLPSPKEVVVVPTTKPEAVAHLELKKVILLYSSDCYDVYAVGGYIRYCQGAAPLYVHGDAGGGGGGAPSGSPTAPNPGTPNPCDPNNPINDGPNRCPYYVPPVAN